MTHLNVSVHVDAGESHRVNTFDATDDSGPFVALKLGEPFGGVTLMVREEEALNDLASLIAEARASLAGAINRAKHDEATQPELPELAAS